MKDYNQIITELMFSYEVLSKEDFAQLAATLPIKLVRWLVAHHPDNRCRKDLLRISNVECGAGSVINIGFVVSDDYKPLLTIGERVAVSPNVVVVCASSPNNSSLLQAPGFRDKYVKSEPVIIDDDAWIGTGAIILPGIRIGKRAVVGAGAIVHRDVNDDIVVAGNPANQIHPKSGG